MDARWKPMLCEPAEAMPTSPDGWVLEPKFDGWRAIVHLGDNGVVLYGGRNGNSYSGQVPYIEQALADNLPPNTVLDGELIHPDGWGSVQSAMTTRGGLPGITFVAFDVLAVNANDVRALEWENRTRT
jgi:ATP-dependent DNA ligase